MSIVMNFSGSPTSGDRPLTVAFESQIITLYQCVTDLTGIEKLQGVTDVTVPLRQEVTDVG